MAGFVGGAFQTWLLLYFALTSVYTLKLKQLPLLDCVALALLHTLRIVAGAAAVHHDLSFWLLAFSVFLFLSLAFVKRYSELDLMSVQNNKEIHGRGYVTSDKSLILIMGIVAGYTSVLVLALYLNSEAVVKLYESPELLWGAVLIMLYWISWVWMQAHRGKMKDDPLIFAVRDKTSLIAGFMFSLVLLIGASGYL